MYGELCDLAADSAADMADYLAANRTINKATNQATNMTANRTANLAANMATNVTAKVTAHKATSMVQGVGQGCIRVRTWLHASHHCGKLELPLTNGQAITYDETRIHVGCVCTRTTRGHTCLAQLCFVV